MYSRLKTVEERKRDWMAAGLIALCALLFVWWWVSGSSTGEADVPGTYVYRSGQLKVTLEINSDHTFHEIYVQGGQQTVADGSWYTFGLSRISFSHQFLMLPNQEACNEEKSCGSVYNLFGFKRIELGLGQPGLRFSRQLFQ